MGNLKLWVVTPQRRILAEKVESVRVPGTEGSLGILPRHAPLLTALKAGVVHYRKVGGQTTEQMAVSGGFMEVGPGQVIILADLAELSSEIDVARARRAKEKAEKYLRENPRGSDLARAEEALQKNIARLKAAGAE